jgi:hypothetical protein
MGRWRHLDRRNAEEYTIHEAAYDVLRGETRLQTIATRTGIPYDTLKSWTVEPDNPAQSYRAMPAHQVVPVTLATGNTRILDVMEQAVGRVAFAMPAVADPPRDVLVETAAATREFGDVLTALGRAVADRRISAGELDQIEDEAYEAIAEIMRAVAAARALHQAPAEARG